MWWPILTVILAVALLGLHLWWRRRHALLRRELANQTTAGSTLAAQHQLLVAQKDAEQHALFNSMVEGVLLLDESGRIQLINQSLQKIFGLRSDVRGKTIMEAFRLQELAQLIARLPAERTVHGFEMELPGMEERHLQVNASAVFDHAGVQHGVLLVFHDLTRIKQLENTRQEFVANVSHELRTPLSLIKGFVETLLDGAVRDPAQASQYLRTIEKHTDRLTFLIEDLLTISRLESGQILMNLHQVCLREEIDRVLDDLRSRAAEKKLAVENLVPGDLLAQADADRLQQVLFNLVENAIKYGHPQGKVAINARPIPEQRIEVSVTDDGPGIPPEARERIFERFYRVDRARSRETGGTGLGLSIVKHIIQAHGGEVWVKSDVGKGTTFYFTLPQT